MYLVKLNTTKGPIVIRVTKLWAPIGADRFYNLVRAGFYNNDDILPLHPAVHAQFGIPARPELSRVWMEHTMFDDRVIQSNKRGMVTFASTGDKNSRSVQVFINKVDNAYLDNLDAGFRSFWRSDRRHGCCRHALFRLRRASHESARRDQNQGNAFLEKNFPRLDKIITAVIEPLPVESKSDDSKKDDAKK